MMLLNNLVVVVVVYHLFHQVCLATFKFGADSSYCFHGLFSEVLTTGKTKSLQLTPTGLQEPKQ